MPESVPSGIMVMPVPSRCWDVGTDWSVLPASTNSCPDQCPESLRLRRWYGCGNGRWNGVGAGVGRWCRLRVGAEVGKRGGRRGGSGVGAGVGPGVGVTTAIGGLG